MCDGRECREDERGGEREEGVWAVREVWGPAYASFVPSSLWGQHPRTPVSRGRLWELKRAVPANTPYSLCKLYLHRPCFLGQRSLRSAPPPGLGAARADAICTTGTGWVLQRPEGLRGLLPPSFGEESVCKLLQNHTSQSTGEMAAWHVPVPGPPDSGRKRRALGKDEMPAWTVTSIKKEEELP